MIRKTSCFEPFLSSRIVEAVLGAFILLGTLASASTAFGAEAVTSRHGHVLPLHIEVQDAHGAVVADSAKDSQSPGTGPAVLSFQHAYQPGDRIIVTGPSRMAVRVDDRIPECLVYLTKSPQTDFSFDIPYGEGEGATRSPFSPDSFAGEWHRVTARALAPNELSGYRNLAMNACDQELQTPAVEETTDAMPASIFPHASTNSVSRSLPDFRARNAIDGETLNGHHGIWPYQSWGPQLRLDLWWKVDFGRPVELDKLRLMVRSDFPHDSYWQSAVIEFSDGESIPIQIKQVGEFQDFTFPKRTVSWVRLNKLVPADPARWCALIEVEAWGRELK